MSTHTLLQAADIMIIIFLIYLQITPHTRKVPICSVIEQNANSQQTT